MIVTRKSVRLKSGVRESESEGSRKRHGVTVYRVKKKNMSQFGRNACISLIKIFSHCVKSHLSFNEYFNNNFDDIYIHMYKKI